MWGSSLVLGLFDWGSIPVPTVLELMVQQFLWDPTVVDLSETNRVSAYVRFQSLGNGAS